MDDLTRINGIGKATAAKLVAAGIDTFEKLAHDGLAGELGVKVEWVAEAARLLHENSEGTALSGPALVDAVGAAGEPVEADPPAAPAEQPVASEAAGGPSQDAPPSDQDAGGAPQSGAPGMPLAAMEEVAGQLEVAETAFRAAYPHFSAAIDALMARGGGEPRALRIVSRVEGFRRAGIAHGKAPVEHPIGRFPMAQLEQIFAEPNLSAEFV